MTKDDLMSTIAPPERVTQQRVITLFQDELKYDYLGDWHDRNNNRQVEDGLLTDWLTRRGCSQVQIGIVLHKLHTEADNPTRTLYENNRAVCQLLRYGVLVKTEAGQNHQTVHLIDWAEPEANHFAVAEEVTLKGGFERRPDLVLYVNGLAVAVIELKNSDDLKRALPALLAKWQPIVGVHAERCYVQHMKTKWGSCNPVTGNIRLNTELAKKPPECLEYIFVHELLHLREPTHNDRFVTSMTKLMPHWQDCRDKLNRLPVRNEHWSY